MNSKFLESNIPVADFVHPTLRHWLREAYHNFWNLPAAYENPDQSSSPSSSIPIFNDFVY
ncbi:hypothetical protein CERSUDRAFT_94163 [Gelatoporia subvermispora B]|uniref:Uncharacterized protein n=1 Tax=Ceriporiopsis subvermispora (strain B) TaxID=914234 RepID=M2RIJ5_CERS8|nr:hypothetical protein CERSUDRAFT_94163 [Gelatoporia subvermispora B]